MTPSLFINVKKGFHESVVSLVNQLLSTNIKSKPKAKAAETYTGIRANLINSNGEILFTHSFDFQKKNKSPNTGENIAYIHKYIHLTKSAINNAAINIKYIIKNNISIITFIDKLKIFLIVFTALSSSVFIVSIFIIQYV